MLKDKIIKKVKSKTTKTKTSKIDSYIKKGQAIIDRGINSGLKDVMIEKLGTLNASELIKSQIGLEKLKNKMKFIRELPSIREANLAYDTKVQRNKAERIAEEQLNKVKNEFGQDVLNRLVYDKDYSKLAVFEDFDNKNLKLNDLKALIDEMKRRPATEFAQDMMDEKINTFFEQYFKELRLNAKDRPKLSLLENHFKNNLKDFYDFVDYVCHPSFTKYYDSERGKYGDLKEYENEMRDRLDRMVDLTKTKKYK